MIENEIKGSESPESLMRQEREIARKHIGKFPYFAVIWAFTNLAVWLSLWPLVLLDILPLWAGFIIATISISLCYLPSHEAQHDIIARPGEKLYWLNELIGHLSVIPLVTPYRALRFTHLEHHKHTNDPDFDPDYSTRASSPLGAIWKSLVDRQPGATDGLNGYANALERVGRPEVVTETAIANLIYFSILFALAWSGYAFEAIFIWWLPRHIAITYIQFFLSWAPHHPADETERYRNTRSFRSRLGNIGSLGMQYHIVHHLHPRIPLYRTPMAYWEMRDILEKRGARVDEL